MRLLLLTGQRLREVSEMSWPEVDLQKRLLVIPAERMKADAPHVVPLVAVARQTHDMPQLARAQTLGIERHRNKRCNEAGN